MESSDVPTKTSGLPIARISLIGLGVLVVVMFVCIVLVSLGRARRSARCRQNDNQARGIHQACILYSQQNNYWFPGFDRDGNAVATDVEQRLKIMLDDGQFSAQYLISPSETKTPWSAGPFTTANYSYAMLQLPDGGARRKEWRSTSNSRAVVLSDRIIQDASGYRSVHFLDHVHNEWRGQMVWNDNHVTFEPDYVVNTDYAASSHTDDNIFAPANNDDAYMIHSGNQ